MNFNSLISQWRVSRLTVFVVTLVFLSWIGEVRTSSADNPEFNRRATATAQILAGITPNPPDPALKRFVESDTFKEHQQWMTSSWAHVRGRIQTM
jgi:sensor histidine kinase regulating citrate/malate metabolism